MNLTWLGIVVLVLIAGACITGFQKGFVKEVVATFFVLFSIIISGALNPYVSSFLRERTPVYNMVKENCRGGCRRETGWNLRRFWRAKAKRVY